MSSMSEPPAPAPAIDGWFTRGGDAALIGSRCASCGTYAFPKETFSCRNPACASTDLDQVELGRRGMVWSFAVNHYPPPSPGLSTDPFEPYTVAAVQLAEEQIVVLGLVAGAGAIEIGDEVELVVEPIIPGSDELVWKWRPVA